MRSLTGRLDRIERRLTAGKCAGCAMLKRVRVVTNPDLIDPSWFRCSLCGRQHYVRIILLPETTDALAGGDMAPR